MSLPDYTPVSQTSSQALPNSTVIQPDKTSMLHRAPDIPITYQLERYLWRSFLTFVGPWAVVGFFTFICFYFLAHPSQNNTVDTTKLDAGWIFFLWFVIGVLALDWTKAGLSNIEAAALMQPRLAPSTAAQLMWHTDNKWANPLWWLRAIRNEGLALLSPRLSSSKRSVSRPGTLWYCISCVMLLLFIALPLSGLTIEITGNVYMPGQTRTLVYGPNDTTFSQRSMLDMQTTIHTYWESGGSTSPRDASIIYAPNGTTDVSASYFDDLASQNADFIEFFIGPAVRTPVSGRAWGVWSNISCMPVHKDQLQMIRVDDNLAYSIDQCAYGDCEGNTTEFCHLIGWRPTTSLLAYDPMEMMGCAYNLRFPRFINKTSGSNHLTKFSFIAVADGTDVSDMGGGSPFIDEYGHDPSTFDAMNNYFNNRSQDEPSTAMFETFLWQSSIRLNDSVLANLTSGQYPGPIEILRHYPFSSEFPKEFSDFAGIGVHCEITTSVGYATLDAAQSTFTNFNRSRAISNGDLNNFPSQPSLKDVKPPQILALQALEVNLDTQRQNSGTIGILSSVDDDVGYQLEEYDEIWQALHGTVGGAALPPGQRDWARSNAPLQNFRALTPQDMQFAMYKLLGESVIQLMSQGAVEPWYGELYSLESRTYLTPGRVSWKLVLAILMLWAVLMSGGALWIVCFAGVRWAPSLSGFEMFKFGAQHADEVEDFAAAEFTGCRNALDRVPGMVGMLPGTARVDRGLGFIGLSENRASQEAEYTWERKHASATRPTS